MSDLLRVSLVQTNIVWGDVKANLQKLTPELISLKGESDLIVLPEMFSSGFLMEGKEKVALLAQETLSWMNKMAFTTQAYIMGSLIQEQDDTFYNRLYVISPSGNCKWYDKRHLFRMGKEHLHFGAGKRSLTITVKGWRIRPLVCYDLRFPVWSRNRNDYDLLIYIANWPKSRRVVWNTLLKARAIENQSCVVGVNRVGVDGMGLRYCGDSIALNSKGESVQSCSEDTDQIKTAAFSIDELKEFRNKFPVEMDADNFDLIV